jgi:hypothetical protein
MQHRRPRRTPISLPFDFEPADFNPSHDPHSGEFTSEGGGSGGGAAVEHGMHEASARAFVESRDVSTRQQFLSPHPAEEMGGHTMLTNKDGTVGVSVDPHGDIQNVFNNGGPKGGAAKAMVAAIEHGGKTLDCYDGFLPSYYHQFGFQEDQRMKFNRDFAPKNWDYAKHNEPDIVFMSWRGYGAGGAKGALTQVANRKDWSKPTRATKYGDNWDAAKAASRTAAHSGRARDHRLADDNYWARIERAGDRIGVGAGARSGRTLIDENECHDPGSGEFCSTGGGGASTEVDPAKPIDPGTSDVISPNEKKSLDKYQSKNGFKKFNKPLREGAAPSADANNLSSAIAKHSLAKDVTVYRGMGNTVSAQLATAWDNKKSGESVTFTEKGFLSTSRSRGAAATFSNQLLELKVPKGYRALPMARAKGMGGEAEILLDRNTKFKVIGVGPGVTKGSRLFRVELVQ